MEKNPSHILELVFAGSDTVQSKKITAQVEAGTLRKIAPRIYTSNLADTPAAIIRRNWYRVLAALFPNALLSHRTALEARPTPDGHIYLTYTYTRNVTLPGLTIHFLKGPGRIDGDQQLFENLYVSQEARAYLENLQSSRSSSTEPKTLPLHQVEERLEAVVRARGERGLNAIRDRARSIAADLGMETELKKLNELISSLLSTGNPSALHAPAAIARALGEPLDPDRDRLFENLYEALAGSVYPQYADKNSGNQAYRAFAFFESYFSNYIEGTEFTVGEAKEIIETELPIPSRDEDSHDILGTYRIVSDKNEMATLPANADQLLDLLRTRHAVLLQSRTSKKPGEFKDRNNRAGNTEFVDWQLVTGTLKKGFEWYSLLREPFARAAFMMFMITEVHPFNDGNGRIARVMMNAELSARQLTKIIIPTVFREDYMGALRKLTRQRTADAYIRMMLRAYEFSTMLVGDNIDAMERQLIQMDAFKEPGDGKLRML